MKNSNIKVVDHSLVKSKITILRNKETDTNTFRIILEEVAAFLTYEALKNIPLKEIMVDTPIAKKAKGYILEEDIIVVPIFRAGLGMVNGVRRLFPNIKEGHIGIYRDEKTNEIVRYYNKLPKKINKSHVLLLDPMLATGSTIYDAISTLVKSGAKKISVLSIVATSQGIESVQKKFPDISIIVATIDEKLNDKGYIYPGLGDAGDRIFGTK